MRIGQIVGATNVKLSEKFTEQRKDPLMEGLQTRVDAIQERMKAIDDNEHFTAKQKEKFKTNLTEQLQEAQELLAQRKESIAGFSEPKNVFDWQDDYDFETTKNQMMNLVEMSKSLSQVQQQYSTNLSMKHDARILASEIKSDKGRGVNVESKEKSLTELNDKIDNLTKKITDEMSDVSKEIKKGVKVEDKDKAENANDSKENEDKTNAVENG